MYIQSSRNDFKKKEAKKLIKMNGNEQKRITYFKNIILIFQCQEDNSNQLYNARYVNSNFHGSNKNFLNDGFLVF